MSRASKEVERRILRHLHGHNSRMKLGEIHAHILRHDLHKSNQVLSHFVSVCRAVGKMGYAELIFEQAQHPNIFLFNSMIKGYSTSGPFEKSLLLFSVMKNRGIWSDEYTLAPLLKSCCNLGDMGLGGCVHGEAIRLGFGRYQSIGIGVVELYATCGKIEDAYKMFDEMPTRNVVAWNLMVHGYCRNGDVDKGLRMFRQMEERSIVSWNSMISSLASCGRNKEALALFHEMVNDGFQPDEATVVTMLPVCARIGALDVGKWIQSYAASSKTDFNSVSVGNSTVDFYCKCGDIENALSVFSQIPQKSVISWNAIMSGLAFNGKGQLGVELFEEMICNGVKPDDSSFVAVLTCCSHAKMVQKGRDLFAAMSRKFQLEPKLEHYGCMVDLLGRIGCIEEAYNLIKNMPMQPNAALWGSLLSASRSHGDIELAKCIIKELIDLEPWNSGNYVLLSNMYAEGERWDEVERLRVSMKDSSINKEAGQSFLG